MTRRKPHNMRARLERAAGALLRQHHACIVDASVPEVQVMLNYKNLRQILTTQVANARVQSRGRGAQSEAQAMGWLSRAFNSVAPF